MSTTTKRQVFTESERRIANVAMAVPPLAVLLANTLVSLDTTTLGLVTLGWLLVGFAPFRFSVPSVAILNYYRRRIAAMAPDRHTEGVLVFSSQLRAGYWANVLATFVVAALTWALYLS